MSERSKSCPDTEVWLAVAANSESIDSTDALLRHAAECQRCMSHFEDAIAIVTEVPAPGAFIHGLEIDRASGRKALSAKMASLHSSRSGYRWAIPFAATVLVCLGTIWMFRGSSEEPLLLLARSYEEHRTMEMRVPRAAYSRVQVERGSSGVPSTQLLRAKSLINAILEKTPRDASALHAKGRAESLEGDFEKAIATLKLAESLSGTNPELQVDLALAYFGRAGGSGSSRDYELALAFLDRANASSPREEAIVFNRAAVLAKLNRRGEAIKAFQEAASISTDPRWQEEARQRAAQLDPN